MQKFDIQDIQEGAWMRIPTFKPSLEEEQDCLTLLKQLASLRSKAWIVFDVRGNRGGDSKWARAMVRNLYGDSYLQSLKESFSYNQPWRKKFRVSAYNLTIFKNSFPPHIVQAMEKVLERKEKFYSIEWSLYDSQGGLLTHDTSEEVSARIFLLTDGKCSSSCWLFIRDMLQIPGVIQLGEETDILTPYSELGKIPLPSGKGYFHYPLHKFLFPTDHLGESFKPTFRYPDDRARDEKTIKQWVLETVKKNTKER